MVKIFEIMPERRSLFLTSDAWRSDVEDHHIDTDRKEN
jgi:hypothetical protein